ncbi:MAG: hypothetical protein HYS44_04060 [Candidatus Niyogibacteria bacterium]|nr:hypothetical protein [Candidatus Niyogibacteria bacterium]
MDPKNIPVRLLAMVRLEMPRGGFHLLANQEMHPKRWWPVLLIGAAALLVLTLAFNIGFFVISTRAIRSASESGFDLAQVAVNRTELANVMKLLDARERESRRILNEPAPGDPSR